MVITNNPFDLGREFDNIWTQTFTSASTTYPPYNVVKINDDKIIMEFAVAGFNKDNISITTEKNVLSIKAEKQETEKKTYIHKGIATRKFSRAFQLPEYFEVESAGYEDGILYIDLIRNIPEEKKPKSITIK